MVKAFARQNYERSKFEKENWEKFPRGRRGQWIYSTATDSVAYTNFTGTRIDLVASKAPSYGIARVLIDGGGPYYADLYDASFRHQQRVLSVSGLATGTHNVSVEYSGSKNAS